MIYNNHGYHGLVTSMFSFDCRILVSLCITLLILTDPGTTVGPSCIERFPHSLKAWVPDDLITGESSPNASYRQVKVCWLLVEKLLKKIVRFSYIKHCLLISHYIPSWVMMFVTVLLLWVFHYTKDVRTLDATYATLFPCFLMATCWDLVAGSWERFHFSNNSSRFHTGWKSTQAKQLRPLGFVGITQKQR